MKPTIVKNPLNALQQVDIAALFGVTDRTIRNWDAEGLPGNGEGRGRVYVWAEVLAWRDARISGSRGGDVPSDKEREQKAKADMAEMERDKMAGSLVDAGEIKAAYCDFLARLRTNIRGLPDRLVPRLEEGETLAERMSIAKALVDELLRDVVAQEQEATRD